MTRPDVDAAAQFLAASARILDRRRFECLFRGGPAAAVRDAVAAYRTADGGFGHALEPDCRAPGSQPGTIEVALRVLDECGAWDRGLVAGACDWLAAHAPSEGGAVFVDPSIAGWPHAPWWEPQPDLRASLIATGRVAGTLLARGVEHPWLGGAVPWLWKEIESLPGSGVALGPYDLFGVINFLQHTPDRARASGVLPAVGEQVHHALAASDEGMSLLDFAALPGSIGRAWFTPGEVEAALDRLAAGQQDDGGWTFGWPAWSPVAAADWRGAVTVDALRILRDNSRL
ncbi:MAG TPA: hypothetical protein VFW71_05925 [Actinomycetota bacterium]|nr:hypothetical protein [Actinomycetota bacterium]